MSVQRALVLLVCILVPQTKAFGRLTEAFEHRYIADTPCGWIGAGDWTEFAGKPGIGYPAPGPQRTISHVYLGPVEFYLPGKASFWVLTGPMLMFGPLFAALVLQLRCDRRSRWPRVVTGAIVGLYYGVVVVFAGYIEFGTIGRSTIWTKLAGSPLGIAQLEAGVLFWGLVGLAVAGLSGRAQGHALLLLMISHYLGVPLLAMPNGLANVQDFQSLRLILRLFPVWFMAWAIILVAGEAYMWIMLFRAYRGNMAQQDGPANGSQPIGSETDRTSSTAGSRR